MDWVYYAVLIILLLAGLFINLLGLPGFWVMVASALGYAWLTHWRHVGWPALVRMLVLAPDRRRPGILRRLSAGAKKAGGSKRGMVGGLVGGLLGAIFLSVVPIPGVAQLVGADHRHVHRRRRCRSDGRQSDVDHSVQIGIGAAKGVSGGRC